MKVLTLYRLPPTETGTFGAIADEDGSPICDTLERPWKDNQHDTSSIPVGEYTIQRIRHDKFGETFQVLDVPNRDGIFLHRANLYSELHGCIAFGAGYAEINGITGVINSGLAKDRFMKKLEGIDEAKLVIIGRQCPNF